MQMDNLDLDILVIGCGSIGRRHATNIVALQAGEVSVFDTDQSACSQLAAQSGAVAVRDLSSAWDDTDVVVVAAPTQHHLALAQEAVGHGCHLFIEKPLSYDLKGVESLCDALNDSGLTSMVACNMRFHPGPTTVKHWLDEGAVGQVLSARLHTGSYLPEWRPDQEFRSSYSADQDWGGAVLDCIHEIDLALWYLGSAELLAACSMPAETIGLETDGLAELILRHASQSISSIHLNFVQRDYSRTCQIIGSEGTIYWDMQQGQVVLKGSGGKTIRWSDQPAGWQLNQMYVDEMAHFLTSVRDKRVTVNPVQEAVAALSIAIQARRVERGVAV